MVKPSYFSFVAPDNNMEPFVFAGDTVIVQRMRRVREGDMVIVSPRGFREQVIGLIRKKGGEFHLQRTGWADLVLGGKQYFDMEGRVIRVEQGGAARTEYVERTKKQPSIAVGQPFRITLAQARSLEHRLNDCAEVSPAISVHGGSLIPSPELPPVEHPSHLPEPKAGTPLVREVRLDRRRLTSRTANATRMFQALAPLPDIGRPKGEVLIVRQPRQIEPGMMILCKVNHRHVVRYVALDQRLRVYLETQSTRSAPIFLSASDEVEILGQVIEQQLDM